MSDQQKHITPEQFEKYLKGVLSPEESHAVEAAMQSHPLYEEAMDGLASVYGKSDQDELAKDLHALQKSISMPQAAGTPIKRVKPWLRIAASVIFLLIALPVLWILVNQGPSSFEATEQADKASSESDAIAMQEEKTTGRTADSEARISNNALSNDDEDHDRPDSGKPALTAGNQQPAGRSNPGGLKTEKAKEPEKMPDERLEEIRTLQPAAALVEETEEVFLTEADAEITEDFALVENEKRDAEAQMASKTRAEQRKKASVLRNTLAPTDSGKLVEDDFGVAQRSLPFPTAKKTVDKLEEVSVIKTPSPEGGEDAFEVYLGGNGITTARQKSQKPVLLSFEVGSDSTLQNILIEKGNTVNGERIKKVLQNGPKWIPDQAKKNNRLKQKFWLISKKIEKI